MMKTLLFILATMFVTVSALAGDRVVETQSRITGALAGILPKTDYLVVVNKIDALDVSNGTVVSGNVRSLPGLRVGVDDEGQVVVKDAGDAAYSGPVSVTVVIDSDVKIETYRAIETLLPEIMGGSRSGDEVKLKRAVLRQPEEEKAPQIVVNNAPAPLPDTSKSTNDFYKISAVFFVGLGLLLWMMSRRQNDSGERKTRSQNDYHGRGDDKGDGGELKSNRWDPAAFDGFDPEILGLFVLKSIFEKDIDRVRSFFRESTPATQKAALGSLPSWLASHCLEQIEPKEGERPGKHVNPEMIMREITVMEKAMQADPSAKSSAFIQWIPAESMGKVHPENLAAPSDETRYAIISLRPDLARAFRYDENDALISGMIFNAKAIVAANKEMTQWRTRLGVTRSAKTTVVEAMAGIINRTETFAEVETKLRGIQKKMAKIDWDALQPRIVSVATFEALTEMQKKDFLRAVDPSDYYFIVSSLNVAFDWELDKLLRPKRLASFRAAEHINVHEQWSEDQKREASARALNHLRAVFLGEQSVAIDVAA